MPATDSVFVMESSRDRSVETRGIRVSLIGRDRFEPSTRAPRWVGFGSAAWLLILPPRGMHRGSTMIPSNRARQGVLAKNKDLIKAFGTDNHVEVCKIILDKGEMQVRE